MAKKKASENTIEEKLNSLYHLQLIDSQIDKIRTVRGELPLEVQDLEDEIQGLETRLEKLQEENTALETLVTDRKNMIKDSKAAIKKYTEQQKNVRNNREFDSISKEIEFQELEIELSDKKINEALANIEHKAEILAGAKAKLEERQKDLDIKRKELQEISAETEKDEQKLMKESEKAKSGIEERLITAYDRLRNNSKNGLAVVSIERDSCGGCFNQIPPQRQIDIQARKRIIVCEHCGRILVEPPVDAK
jgi:predicted  nucleic acid-binding Zn-ribbon protein